jgi:hypothetical protein
MRVAVILAARYIGDREENKRRSCMRRKMMKNIYPDKIYNIDRHEDKKARY